MFSCLPMVMLFKAWGKCTKSFKIKKKTKGEHTRTGSKEEESRGNI